MILLQVKNLKKYFKELKAVDGVDFEIEQGEIFGLLGPNGAGKSTTISMLSTLTKPTEGEIFYKGESILKNPKYIQEKLGVVPQDIALYPMLTGYENLKFWGHIYGLRKKKLENRIHEVAEIIGLKDKLKEKVEKYSGGMKRRINIGAALLHEPELLIMDEPTVGIDAQSRNHILDTVIDLNKKGMTIIYTSHYMEEVELLCNKISIMDKGRIIETGTKEELKSLINEDKIILLRLDNITDQTIFKLNEIKDIKDIEINDDTIVLKVEDTKKLFEELVLKVGETNSNIISIDVKRPNLESVFLNLTGKTLRD
ncbi:ABC transporter ATP-binding protein [Gottschalkia purinilytica]|uniref:ABC transporter ATP-binding protein n=1 Tax=Gottschalkia purinilytica TaxID=1503 RepID=A0A0L0W9H3_GOTPU|nr:ATP-binding cassette domain-containing protein [Gottschalkia purinilytica]KNF08208.1 ABC transporter ATP-binding protein [Gottschalkia purinilytica]